MGANNVEKKVLNYKWRGAWATSTTFALRDTVLYTVDGDGYICLIPHTSGTFATDLAAGKWEKYTDGFPYGFLDEDNMASNSATSVPSQQSVKAYVDTQRAGIAVPYAVKTWVNNAANYSTTSTSATYIDSTNAKATVTLKYGKLVMVDLFMGGIYNSNIGYAIGFDIGLGGASTKSTSGAQEFGWGQWSGNWSTDGTSIVGLYSKFYFVDCGTGSKDFYALWYSGNASVTAYQRQYGASTMYITELFM